MPQSYSLPKLIAIVGPTASGKTKLATKLARKFRGEIVSADSRQIYRGMDIGTAKWPSNSKLEIRNSKLYFDEIPHHLIDIRDPNQSYTLGEYKRDSLQAIRQILKRGKLPLLVGGTGLYVSAVLDNFEVPSVRPNQKLRAKLEKQAQKHGLDFLYKKLLKLDPEAAYVVDPKNPRRVIRALEVATTTGKPFTQLRKKGPKLFDGLILGLSLSKDELKKRIQKRTSQMIKQGLVAEVKNLLSTFDFQLSTFQAIGYREIIQYLHGEISLLEAETLINQNTYRFAKRQMTWFRKMPVIWIRNQKEAESQIKKFLTT